MAYHKRDLFIGGIGLVFGYLASKAAFASSLISAPTSSENQNKSTRDKIFPTKTGSACVRTRINTRFSETNKNYLITYRTAHKTNIPIANLVLEYWNGFVLNSGISSYSEQSPERSAGIGIIRASIITGIHDTSLDQRKSTLTKITWHEMETDALFLLAGGQVGSDGSWIKIPPGYSVRSDPVSSISLSSGERYFVQTEDTRKIGDLRPLTFKSRTDLGDAVFFSRKSTDNVAETDWRNAWQGAAVMYGPSFIWGNTTDKKPIFMVDGDSIISEARDDGDGDGALAFGKRALNKMGFSFFDLSVPGTNMTYVLRYDAFRVRERWVRYADVILSNHGNNDLGDIGFEQEAPKAGLLDIVKSHNKYLRSLTHSGVSIIRTTFNPRTFSSDGWVSLDNQTPKSSDDQWPKGARYEWRDYVLGLGRYSGRLPDRTTGDHYFDLYHALKADSGRWPVNDRKVKFWATADGTHPSQIAHEVAADALAEALKELKIWEIR